MLTTNGDTMQEHAKKINEAETIIEDVPTGTEGYRHLFAEPLPPVATMLAKSSTNFWIVRLTVSTYLMSSLQLPCFNLVHCYYQAQQQIHDNCNGNVSKRSPCSGYRTDFYIS